MLAIEPIVNSNTDASFNVQTNGLLYPWMRREWLLTNGLGAFASSTVVGCNIRRYHGLLCAAITPPVGRMLALSRIAEAVVLDGNTSARHELGVNQFQGAVHPRGERYLKSFHLWETANWEYAIDGVQISKTLMLCWKKNLVGVRYNIRCDRPRSVRLELAPFTGLRDFHGSRHSDGKPFKTAVSVAPTPQVVASDGPNILSVIADSGSFEAAPDWWFGHVYPIEAERGLGDSEDLFTPGRFVRESDSGQMSVTLWVGVEPEGSLADWEQELQQVREARRNFSLPGGKFTSPAVKRLMRAASDFVVDRTAPDGSPGTSVIAGYPWFADWGRDTFISLPGLLLTTGRLEEARRVLTVFGHYVDRGMIPNRFDDYSNEAHYNTVDASLWYIHAAFEYLRLSGDRETFEKALRPACKKIIDGYRDGTRYNIHADADGLIIQGDASTQLTWMDAKCGDIAFTPRQGKAVDINALWYHALMLMGETEYAAKVAESFRAAYWISPWRGLADGVNEGRQDRLIRPNQIFAVSLEHSPLTPEQQAGVVEVVRRELLTPVGLRTLARSEPGYRDIFAGGQFERDGAYHNGTIWPWLIGGFLSAYLKVHKNSPPAREQCREWLQPLIDHMEENCLGQIAEIFEAREPHHPVGCCAQAWSVAEVLRLAVELEM